MLCVVFTKYIVTVGTVKLLRTCQSYLLFVAIVLSLVTGDAKCCQVLIGCQSTMIFGTCFDSPRLWMFSLMNLIHATLVLIPVFVFAGLMDV